MRKSLKKGIRVVFIGNIRELLSAGSKITGFVPTDQVVRQGENRERGKAGVMGSSVLEHMHDVYPKEALARDIKQERCSLR